MVIDVSRAFMVENIIMAFKAEGSLYKKLAKVKIWIFRRH